MPENDYYSAQHTVSATELARIRGLLKEGENGEQFFGGREIITRDTFPIEGKVDIRSWVADGEALVIDSQKYPEGYNRLRSVFEQKMAPHTEADEYTVLESIYSSVVDTMEYDLDATERLFGNIAGNTLRKVNLGEYIREGRGVCRHMALAETWLAGELHAKGLLRGRMTAEVNQRADKAAHEWARYTAENGEVYILDPAQKFFGTLEEASKVAQWEYFRPGEKEGFLRRRLGHEATNQETEISDRVFKVERSQRHQAFVEGVEQLLAVERHFQDEGKPLSEKTLPNIHKATMAVLGRGAVLLVESVKQTDISMASELGRIADMVAKQLQDAGAAKIERYYPEGVIAGVAEQKAWFGRACDTLRSLPASDSEQEQALIHLGLEVAQAIARNLDTMLQAPQAA